jgi:hypothetical protein
MSNNIIYNTYFNKFKFAVNEYDYVILCDEIENGLENEMLQILMKKYKSLGLYGKAYIYMKSIPKYITKLTLDFKKYNTINFNNLHDGLITLNISNNNGGNFNNSISNLPNTLRELTIISNTFSQTLDLLPVSLKYFQLVIFSTTNLKFNNLPHNLEHFELLTLYKKMSINSPCLIQLANFNTLPANIKKVIIDKSLLTPETLCHLKKKYNDIVKLT